jgi:hypothetical protein
MSQILTSFYEAAKNIHQSPDILDKFADNYFGVVTIQLTVMILFEGCAVSLDISYTTLIELMEYRRSSNVFSDLSVLNVYV